MLLFGIVVAVAFYLLVTTFGTTGGGRLLFVLIQLVVLWPPLALLTAVIYFELRGPEPASTVPTFGLPPLGTPGTIPIAGAFQPSVDLTQPPAEVSWDTSRSMPPPPPSS